MMQPSRGPDSTRLPGRINRLWARLEHWLMGLFRLRRARKEGGRNMSRDPLKAPPTAEASPVAGWLALGASVQGALHRKKSLPNQDALAWRPDSRRGPPIVLAVADGHGSAKSFRSGTGARLAVEQAAELLMEFLHSWQGSNNLSLVKHTAEDQLPKALARCWKQAVQEHLAELPLAPAELDGLENSEGPASRSKVEREPVLAYGTTLLAVAVADTFLLYVQQGDGDILAVTAEGEADRPLPRDERLFANETTSLSSQDAGLDFRVGLQPLPAAAPVLILVATDGYANSFRSDACFRQVGSDLLRILRTDGLAEVEGSLAQWLAETTAAGSGDDITLGLLCRQDILARGEATRPADGSAATVMIPDPEGACPETDSVEKGEQ